MAHDVLSRPRLADARSRLRKAVAMNYRMLASLTVGLPLLACAAVPADDAPSDTNDLVVEECKRPTPLPVACAAVYQPVCGCDGKTYSNACVAKVSVTRHTPGACPDEGATRVCTGAFFDAHPVVDRATDSTGFVMPIPFAACDAEFTVLFGSADRAAVAARLAGTGYEPVKLAGGKTVARVYVVNFGKSDVGAYTEMTLSYDVVREGTAGPEIPWVNAYSTLVPAFTPGTTAFLDRLVLQRGAGDRAIRAGREHAGLDKRPGIVDAVHVLGYTTFVVRDEVGASVVAGTLGVNLDPAAQLAEANALAQAFGLPDASALPAPAPELVVPLVNKDLRNEGALFHWSGVFNQPTTALGPFAAQHNSLYFGNGELGRWLRTIAFKPAAIARYFDVDVVYPVGQ